MSKFTEDKLELAFIELLGKEGIPHVSGKEITRNTEEVLLKEDLRKLLSTQCCTYFTDLEGKKIEGFRYKSTLSEEGYNYVFFNKYPDSFTNEEIVNL